tara:strand:+ start:5798 stop:6052 length:255 start_codon:yes stop_codon:yes gene_type:complete
MTKKVYDGFTLKELDEAFDLIHFPSGDWRDPIQARVLKKDLKVLEAAIIYYCGCSFSYCQKDNQDAWDDYYYIKADGYYIATVN